MDHCARQHVARFTPRTCQRTEAIAATWDVDTIVGMIRADFDRLLEVTTG
jgi:hypothetical protein